MASTKLTRTPSSQGNLKKWTYSMWVKLSGINTEYVLFHNYGENTSREVFAKIGNNNGTIEFALRYDGSYDGRLITNRLFRDPNAWYHFVFVCDTENSTSGDRLKIYVNGVRETSFSTETYPPQNAGTVFNTTHEHTIGSYGSGNYFDGIMSHIHMTDGQAYDASTFGSTDSTTGEWKINADPGISQANYGTNGFWILKDGNSVTDQSGNSNNYAVGGGTLTNTEDCPSNNFTTMNPLQSRIASSGTAYPMSIYSNGNNKVESSNTSAYTPSVGTLGTSSGKYYFECKMGALGYTSFADTPCIGIKSLDTGLYDSAYDDTIRAYSIAGNKNIDGTATSFGNTFTTNDIIGVAMDLDNGAVYFSKNGTWENSGDPTSGSSKTGALATDMASYENWSPFAMGYKGSAGDNSTFEFNFGNGVFGTTAISSEGTNASGIGKFEYDVPTGYTALSTKGLNE